MEPTASAHLRLPTAKVGDAYDDPAIRLEPLGAFDESTLRIAEMLKNLKKYDQVKARLGAYGAEIAGEDVETEIHARLTQNRGVALESDRPPTAAAQGIHHESGTAADLESQPRFGKTRRPGCNPPVVKRLKDARDEWTVLPVFRPIVFAQILGKRRVHQLAMRALPKLELFSRGVVWRYQVR